MLAREFIMNGQNIGYIRVSTFEQHCDRQLRDLIDNKELDRVFIDKCSGKNTDRPQLQECLQYIRSGDTLHIHSTDRLARSVADLTRIVKELLNRNINLHFHKENLIFSADKKNPMNEFMLHILSSVAELELSLIHERQKEGIAEARKRNAYKNVGRKKSLNEEAVQIIKSKITNGQSISSIAREYSITRATVYSYIKKAS